MSFRPEARDKLNQALGQAILRWQYVETALFIIAHGFMGPDYAVNSIVFFHITSAKNKLSLIDKLLEHSLSQRHYQNYWRPIKKQTETAIEFRNHLAHFEAFVVLPKYQHELGSAFELGISSHHLDAHSAKTGRVKIMTVEAIEDASAEFLRVSEILIGFARHHIPDVEQKIETMPPNLRDWWAGKKPTF
jgi:hypothetical protein